LRLAQVRELVNRVEEVSPMQGFPPIVVGDFNAEPDSDEMRTLRGLTPLGPADRSVYFSDVWLFLACDSRFGSGYTYSRSNPYALRSREPSRRIDYIYVRGPDRALRGEPLAARVVFDEARGDAYPSDHYGLYAEIQAAPRPHAPY
jgi:endonuclease/exonuclease/phosphatase family metal-dependent hydrolase